MSNDISPEQARSNKIKLLILIVVPFALMLIAWGMFYSGVGMPTGTGNKGVLFDPPLQLNELVATGDEPIVASDNFNWFFVLPSTAQCDEDCKQRLYLTRQIRTALGKHTHKIQRLLLLEKELELSPDFQQLMEKEHSDAKVQRISAARLRTLLASEANAAKTNPEKDFYLADFRGFMMLNYNEQHSYKDTMKDVKFLLKYAP